MMAGAKRIVLFVLMMSVLETEQFATKRKKGPGSVGLEELCKADKDCKPPTKCCVDPATPDGKKTKICMQKCMPANFNMRDLIGRRSTKNFGKYNISVVGHHLNFLDAAHYCCRQLGGTLLAIKSLAIMDATARLAEEIMKSLDLQLAIWIDGADIDSEGMYTQVFDTSLMKYPMNWFASDEPAGDPMQNCIALAWYRCEKNTLADLGCDSPRGFACKHPPMMVAGD